MSVAKRFVEKCTQVEHHMSVRTKIGSSKFSLIDHLIIFTGPLIPLAVSFQAYNVWIEGKTDGLSIVTWSILLFSSFTMAIYALKHKTKPLIITYIPLVIANLLVVLGILFR